MKKYLTAFAFIAVVVTSCTYNNKTVDDSDQDSTLSGSLNNQDSTRNDTLTNTGAVDKPDVSTDPGHKKEIRENR